MMAYSVEKLINFLEKKFPLINAAKDDPIGLQINLHKPKLIKKVAITLDLNTQTINKCLNDEIDFIILHHPFLYYENLEQELLHAPYKEKIIDLLKKHNIAVYVLHSNINKTYEGMPTFLGNFFDLKLHTYYENNPYLSFFYTSDKLSLTEFSVWIKKQFNVKNTQIYTHDNKMINLFCVLPGRGSIDQILLANQKKPDIILTSDLRWSDWITIKEEKINIMSIPHCMENVFAIGLSKLLRSKFGDIEFFNYQTQEIYWNN